MFCFASAYNAHLPTFHSVFFYTENAEHVDTFTSSWAGRRVWLVPDAPVLTRAIEKIYQDHAYGTIIVPSWAGEDWWPLLFGDRSCVVDTWRLPHSRASFVAGNSKTIVSGSSAERSSFVACSFDCRRALLLRTNVSFPRWREGEEEADE